MKKTICLIAFLVLVINSSHSQKFDMGGIAGINIAKITGSDLSTGEEFKGLDSKTSFHFGLVSEIFLGGKFFLATEILYSSQGTKEGETELKLDYLQFPVMARYYFTRGFNAELGPQLGFLLNSSGNVNNGIISDDNFETSDFSFAFGLGYKMTNGFLIRGRYFLGTNVAKSRKSTITDDQVIDFEYFNNVVQISLGYMFKQ